uniref:Uncharacterized protein n=1 Tax=Salix viminalis TaxID=40686 RepID=A0A6N2LJ54_SALVM
MARMEAMIQRLVGGPLAPANGGACNSPGVEPPPRVARNRPYADDSDDDSEEEAANVQENQLQEEINPNTKYGLTSLCSIENCRLKSFWTGYHKWRGSSTLLRLQRDAK